jgi:hypothetical protein
VSYSLDSNILINLRRTYPRDIFGSLWDSIEDSVGADDVCVSEAVLREVHRGGDDLYAWVKGLEGFVCDVTDDELATVAAIAVDHPEWVRGQVNEADPFLIAHAKAEGSVIITEENRKGPGTLDKNLKIPNVADEHGVACLKFFEFVRTQGWSF